MAKLGLKLPIRIVLLAIYKIDIIAINFITISNTLVSRYMLSSHFVSVLLVAMLSTISKSFQKSISLGLSKLDGLEKSRNLKQLPIVDGGIRVMVTLGC